MGRPPKLLSNEKRAVIDMDLDFAKQMINTPNLTAGDLTVVLRHIDMVRDDLAAAINSRQK